MPHNFIIAIDHVYEGIIKLQTVILSRQAVKTMQNGLSSPLDDNFITAMD